MSGKGDGRRKGANDAAFLKNCPFPSLLERRKAREQEERQQGNDKPATAQASQAKA